MNFEELKSRIKIVADAHGGNRKLSLVWAVQEQTANVVVAGYVPRKELNVTSNGDLRISLWYAKIFVENYLKDLL